MYRSLPRFLVLLVFLSRGKAVLTTLASLAYKHWDLVFFLCYLSVTYILVGHFARQYICVSFMLKEAGRFASLFFGQICVINVVLIRIKAFIWIVFEIFYVVFSEEGFELKVRFNCNSFTRQDLLTGY